jgi:cell division septum initiation protein DivIVA
MESGRNAVVDESIPGYSRAAVDDFLKAAAEERARLEVVIRDADERRNRADAAVDAHLELHNMMIRTLLDTQRELGERRRDAEAQAAAIVEAAERDAKAILQGSGSTVDLFGEEQREFAASDVPHARFVSPHLSLSDTAESQRSKEADAFFDYLRGALVDDEPLGPVGE